MTPEELMQIEKYLLDRKKPDYELSKKIMKSLELIDCQQAEIERLEKQLNSKYKWENMLDKKIKEVKAEAIKEFAEKLKEKKHECGCNYRKKPVYAVTEEKIDETYKEMVGDAQ